MRELAHLVERLSILHPGEVIEPSGLPSEMRRPAAGNAGISGASAGKGALSPGADVSASAENESGLERFLASDMDFKSAKAAFETWYLERKLKEAGGNITRLAELVGLERSYVHRKLKAGRQEHRGR